MSPRCPLQVSGKPDVVGGLAVPGWAWLGVATLLFLSHTLDGIDGKQARRTGSSNPLGELFDHGLDSWATIFITGAIYSLFGRNDDGLSVPVFRMFCVFWNVYLCFLVSHWEKYNTGVLYLPWGQPYTLYFLVCIALLCAGYDFSMLGSFILYLVTAAAGTGLWKSPLPGGLYPAQILEPACYLGNLGMSLPVALYNVRKVGTVSVRHGAICGQHFFKFFEHWFEIIFIISLILLMGFFIVEDFYRVVGFFDNYLVYFDRILKECNKNCIENIRNGPVNTLSKTFAAKLFYQNFWTSL